MNAWENNCRTQDCDQSRVHLSLLRGCCLCKCYKARPFADPTLRAANCRDEQSISQSLVKHCWALCRKDAARCRRGTSDVGLAVSLRHIARSSQDRKRLLPFRPWCQAYFQGNLAVTSFSRANGGPGITVKQLPSIFRARWPEIEEQLLKGRYQPQPVRRVFAPSDLAVFCWEVRQHRSARAPCFT
jgi:hypothetical protein